jgi:hypothetical protein
LGGAPLPHAPRKLPFELCHTSYRFKYVALIDCFGRCAYRDRGRGRNSGRGRGRDRDRGSCGDRGRGRGGDRGRDTETEIGGQRLGQ